MHCPKIVSASNLIPKSTADQIGAVDSDYLLLFKNDSTLPALHAGQGVFAKHHIPANSVLCEYRGPVIAANDYSKLLDDNKTYKIKGPDLKDYKILGENICAFINDCTSVTHRALSFADWEKLNADDASNTSPHPSGRPCYEGSQYNARALFDETGKVFVLSNRVIQPNEEIFIPYRWYVLYAYAIAYKIHINLYFYV